MGSTLTSAGLVGAGILTQTQTLIVNTASTAAEKLVQRNVIRRPGTIFGILVDNQKNSASSTKVWLKVYDDVSDSWTPGTTKSIMGFPIEAFAAGADAQLTGSFMWMHSRTGLVFEKGVSVIVSKEAGDEATADPDTDVAVELTHS